MNVAQIVIAGCGGTAAALLVSMSCCGMVLFFAPPPGTNDRDIRDAFFGAVITLVLAAVLTALTSVLVKVAA